MVISGIQQIGIGVSDVHEAWTWYRKVIGMDVPIFEEAADANLMLPYTGGEPHKRHAVLAINMNGGGGFEIWQYTSRTPEAADFKILLGDFGFNIARLKSRDVKASYNHMKKEGAEMLTPLTKSPDGKSHYYFRDPYDNIFEVLEFDSFFAKPKNPTGGPVGAVIGVSDMDASHSFYRDVLGYDKILYQHRGVRKDMEGVPGAEEKLITMGLRRSEKPKGAFGPLLGPTEIELVQSVSREGRKIFKDRYWGDLGYIHLCFDIRGMDEIRNKCEAAGHPFTVDSSESFDMGEAAGHFTYIEDPDGALIEFVETHKIPILKKIGWYLNLKDRKPEKPLPKLMIRALALNRKKD